MSEEKDIEKIVLHYIDGSVKEVSKGFIASVTVSEKSGTEEITFDMVHISGHDLTSIVSSVMELGIKLGMFGNGEDTEDDIS